MAVSSKAIKTRIKSVKNTKKITKAMELVSAAKMRKAVDATLQARLYATLAQQLMERLSELQEPNYPLFEQRPVKKILMILISSNRGLCGSFNGNVMKFGKRLLEDKKNLAAHRGPDGKSTPSGAADIEVDVLGIGRKSAAFAKKNDLELIEVYDSLGDSPDIEDAIHISKNVTEKFKTGRYDKVVVIFTHFASSLSQTVKVRQLLPVAKAEVDKLLSEFPNKAHIGELAPDNTPIETYFLEPSRDAIFDIVIPRLIDVQVYQALLESAASEHSARMVAMKNASEAASDMIDALTLAFNKARQAAITQEIAEIAGGAAALE